MLHFSVMSDSFVTPWTIAHQTPVHGISQARILEWVAISFSRASSQPRDQTCVSCMAGGFFTAWATREALYTVYILVNLCACTDFFFLFTFKKTYLSICMSQYLRQRSDGVWGSVLYTSCSRKPSCHRNTCWHAVWTGWCVLLPFNGNLV